MPNPIKNPKSPSLNGQSSEVMLSKSLLEKIKVRLAKSPEYGENPTVSPSRESISKSKELVISIFIKETP